MRIDFGLRIKQGVSIGKNKNALGMSEPENRWPAQTTPQIGGTVAAPSPSDHAPRRWGRSRRPLSLHLAAVTLLCALAGLGYAFCTRPYSGTVRLFAFERRFATKAEAADFSALVTSDAALARLKAKLPKDISTRSLDERCQVIIDPGQSYVTASVTAADARSARVLAEDFAAHLAACADEWVAKRAEEADRQIAAAQRRLSELRGQLGDSVVSAVPSVIAPAGPANSATTIEDALLAADAMALRTVQQDLAQAMARYTAEHPRVKELRASIAALQQEMETLSKAQAKANTAAVPANKAEAPQFTSESTRQKNAASEIELARLKSEFGALSAYRDQLVQARVVAGSKDTEKWRRADQVAVARVTEFSRLFNHYALGALAGLVVVSVGQGVSRRRRRVIHNAASLEEAAQLEVLAVLPPLNEMTEAAREYWAVETLNLIRTSARADRRGCFVCGVISSTNGEGRSTVIDLLANAGVRTGNRVLVVPSPDFSKPSNSVVTPPPATGTVAVARQTLLLDAGHAALPVHWERAFSTWQHEENALVLVELPPATTADALIFSAGVPNVLWLSAAHRADARTTARCVNSLRNSGCHLIGAALNMCSSTTLKRAAVWAVLAAALTAWTTASAQPTAPPTNGLSVSKVPVLAPWQEKLTLGPGDVLDFSLYGQADSSRSGVTIGPDGRFSYLQAVDVTATGLTVDELRAKLEAVLMKYHLAPRVVIVPALFRSKKYYILGNVAAKGSYALDHPVTIVEAIARARGFAVANAQRSSFTLADLSLAFLVRRQEDGSFAREPVDFEGLFQRGELQYNKLLAPDDYMYFPPLGLEEVYVLGEVRGTGPVAYTKDLTALGTIAGRGGYTEAAFKEKILIVRGSLQHPETFIVNTADVLRGVGKDFALKPKDIVYVSRKPWAKAEELLEAASSDFVRAVVVTWTGRQIGPIIK